MDQAYTDPEHLRAFAAQLQRFNGEVREAMSGLRAQTARLGETWQDQEFERFRERFARTQQALNRFSTSADQAVPVLLRDAEAIEEYLRHQE